MCGEAFDKSFSARYAQGPSPRVRGSLPAQGFPEGLLGSIPACAGKPASRRGAVACTWVHPRVCGEARLTLSGLPCHWGPSPRVRGSHAERLRARHRPGSIPACAGKPGGAGRPSPRSTVHPRVCGEAVRHQGLALEALGPSPRVRGSRHADAPACHGQGSIPACAGKPRQLVLDLRRQGVHPRVCGEASDDFSIDSDLSGPSPRVRGSLVRRSAEPGRRGSIPACAGKPGVAPAGSRQPWVHPRVCGEAVFSRSGPRVNPGPSPRVRGSRVRSKPCVQGARSIPACAGKPSTCRRWASWCRVHPRVCGEAMRKFLNAATVRGPSPRVRGSRHQRRRLPDLVGSIPACAGKPSATATPCQRRAVHPRVCGEAVCRRTRMKSRRGPSPRVRGSP